MCRPLTTTACSSPLKLIAASSCLLASSFWTGGEQRNAFDPDLPLAVHIRRGHGVQGLALRSADRHADEVARCRNIAKMLATLVEDLDAVGRRHVQTAVSIEATAVSAGALPLCEPRPVEIRELALIRELTIRTDVEDRERAGVRDDDVLLVRREDDAV